MDGVVYLDSAAHAVMPRVTRAAVMSALALSERPDRFDDAAFFEVPDRLRVSLAKLIGASPRQIALTTGASAGLQVVAQNLAWNRGDRIVIAAGDFPLQYATWKPMEARAGAELAIVTPRGCFLTADDVIEAMTPRTRVVSVSHVRFDDASLLDVARIAAACRARGALLVVDVSQSCGAVPVDVKVLGADAVVGAGYKWLLGPYGTGFFWASDTLLEHLPPGPFYWTGQKGDTFASLNMVDPEPSDGAKRFDAPEMATPFNLNLVALSASVDLVLRLGPEAVLQHNHALIDALFERLPEHCAPASPLERATRGPFGCFTAGQPGETAALFERLRALKIFVSLRQGKIRVAPHLFNSLEQIGRAVTRCR
jgi:selenocysteine lyase/cysteine desulfurase